ncbi:MAG: hypothetical protein IJR06_02360, partial [Paludibacteraceae bacterium]|nr:hypothetical protein [Paludibacteraceae bacterium]
PFVRGFVPPIRVCDPMGPFASAFWAACWHNPSKLGFCAPLAPKFPLYGSAGGDAYFCNRYSI